MNWRIWEEVDIIVTRKQLYEYVVMFSPLLAILFMVPIGLAVNVGWKIGLIAFLIILVFDSALIYWIEGRHICYWWPRFIGTVVHRQDPLLSSLDFHDFEERWRREQEVDEWLAENVKPKRVIRYMKGDVQFFWKEDAMRFKLIFGEEA